ncbi:MAG: ATP-binding cassette domain-containing protein [Spirochaetales bacterium]|nr:ATP-binding cassette domain-containing protein [Spirochaetales bacterium]
MVRFDNVTFTYRHGAPVFSNLDWTVAFGEAWAVVGPSGSGKSTLLALLAGLRTATAGEVVVQGETIRRPRPGTGLVFQEYGLLPWLTVRKNVGLGFRIRRMYGPDGVHSPAESPPSRSEAARRVEVWMERLGIAALAGRHPGELSGGQRQRVALARTFVLAPDLLLLDEPFSSLDHTARRRLQETLIDLQRETPHTRIFVTHSLKEAAYLGRKILVLDEERVRILDNPAGNSGVSDDEAYAPAVERLLEYAAGWGAERTS